MYGAKFRGNQPVAGVGNPGKFIGPRVIHICWFSGVLKGQRVKTLSH
jgi:hypothetical protein